MKDIIVSKINVGERIDRFLKREVFFDEKITRGEIIRNIKSGNVLVHPHTKTNNKESESIKNKNNKKENFGVGVNDKTIKPSYILRENDQIEINIPEKKAGIIANKNVKFQIIFENENFVVIDKPAGVQVHPSEKNEADTLVSGLLCKFPEIGTVGDEPENRPGIVHRLDKDTSGIMLVAKNQKTFLELKEKFQKHEIYKTYWAVTHGKLERKKGTIDKSLARSRNYKKQTVANAKTQTTIRPAITEYEVIRETPKYSLVELKPKTGRTHQIRIHLFSIGHPILGDEKYRLKNIKSQEGVLRQLLHAKKIKFSLNGKNFDFEATLPEDFLVFLKKAKLFD